MKSFRQIIMMTLNNDVEEITKYLTIIPLEENFQISFTGNYIPQYSYNGSNWYDWVSGTPVSINMGLKLYVKGNLPEGTKCGSFKTTQRFNLSGNCNSMIFGDDTGNEYAKILTNYNNVFESLFYNCPVVEISEGFLPAHTLGNYCYYKMFQNCTSLVNVPELPATTLSSYCYSTMFQGCTSLTIAPELSATTLAVHCYEDMFRNCSSLTTAPKLPATTLSSYCYSKMFQGCTSLTTAPELSATKLTARCYQYMFRGCSSLTTAPKLPATTLANYCYYGMFFNCASLVTAPELPATTLISNCYVQMFQSCPMLNYIKAMFTTKPSSTYLGTWVSRVSSTGTFVKSKKATWTNTFGSSAIPTGWNVLIEGYDDKYMTIEALEDGLTAKLSLNACEYSTDAINWTSLDADTYTPSINTGEKLYFKGNLTPVTNNGVGTFTITKRCNLKGNCNSLLFGDNSETNMSLTGKYYAFAKLFRNCSTIVSVSEDFLPATTLTTNCYQRMFDGCTSLTTAPELPATTLADNCYNGMFYGCKSLTSAPELPATTLVDYCYYYMFNGCTSLTTAPELSATTLANYCCQYMFQGCTALTTAPVLPATELLRDCYSNMFSGCTKLNYIKAMFTTTPSTSYLNNWVYGVPSTGTFVKNAAATWTDTFSTSAIPIGWTVQTV